MCYTIHTGSQPFINVILLELKELKWGQRASTIFVYVFVLAEKKTSQKIWLPLIFHRISCISCIHTSKRNHLFEISSNLTGIENSARNRTIKITYYMKHTRDTKSKQKQIRNKQFIYYMFTENIALSSGFSVSIPRYIIKNVSNAALIPIQRTAVFFFHHVKIPSQTHRTTNTISDRIK